MTSNAISQRERILKDLKSNIAQVINSITMDKEMLKKFLSSNDTKSAAHEVDKMNIIANTEKVFEELETCFLFSNNFIQFFKKVFSKNTLESMNYIMSMKPSDYNMYNQVFSNFISDNYCSNHKIDISRGNGNTSNQLNTSYSIKINDQRIQNSLTNKPL